jgi:transglutaminase-like putative cysteine protease
MLLRARRLIRTVAFAAFLAAVAARPFGQDVEEGQSSPIDAAAHKVARQILGDRASEPRPPFSSDTEHARSIDPVLTRSTPIWIHEALPSPPLTVLGGKVFSYNDFPYDPLDAPVVKIRPIDDDQVIPFLVRLEITPDGEIAENATVTVSFPAPLIFEPRIRHLRSWVGTKATEVTEEHVLGGSAQIRLQVPLVGRRSSPAQFPNQTLSVIVAGELVLGPYRRVSENRFAEIDNSSFDDSLAVLATLIIDRDVNTLNEAQRLRNIAENITPSSATAYNRVVAATNWVSSRLQYQQSPARRSAIETLEDRSGDCDEHTTLLLALLRAMGIPARPAAGLLYDVNTLATHIWAEVGLPQRDGTIRWFIVDPTLAGTTTREEDKARFVQFKDRVLLYPMKPSVRLEGVIGHHTTDILLNWRPPNSGCFALPTQFTDFVDLATTAVDREISIGAQRLVDASVLFRRRSASIMGSPYVIVDRPLERPGSNSVQLRLENEERLTLDLTAGDGGENFENAIDALRSVYRDLSRVFFDSKPAYHNLELVFSRDRHSDELRAVSLRVGRYLVEHQLHRILKELVGADLVTEEEAAQLTTTAKASNGTNLYLMQELARQIPAGEPAAG